MLCPKVYDPPNRCNAEMELISQTGTNADYRCPACGYIKEVSVTW